jgi:hypothetical protein
MQEYEPARTTKFAGNCDDNENINAEKHLP